jgi:hypothetical protein
VPWRAKAAACRCRASCSDTISTAVEQIAEAGLRQLAFLMQQVALGDQHQPEIAGQGTSTVGAGMGQDLDRMLQHLAPGGRESRR